MREKKPVRPVLSEPRTFDHFPEDIPCPVCGTTDDGKTVLVPIDGTQNGNIYEAQPIHLACCVPTNYSREHGLLYRRAREDRIIYRFIGEDR